MQTLNLKVVSEKVHDVLSRALLLVSRRHLSLNFIVEPCAPLG